MDDMKAKALNFRSVRTLLTKQKDSFEGSS